jgi:hypothetical protein
MGMKCRDMAEIVTHYLEDALPFGSRTAARLHLSLCSSCRRYVEQIRMTIRFLNDGPPPPPPPDEDKILSMLVPERNEKNARGSNGG